MTFPVPLSNVARNLEIVAGTLYEWWNSSTDAPIVSGVSISKTMIRAVNVDGEGGRGLSADKGRIRCLDGWGPPSSNRALRSSQPPPM